MEYGKTSGITGQVVLLFEYNPFFLSRTHYFFCCFLFVCFHFDPFCLSSSLSTHSLHYSVKLSFSCSCVILANLHRSLILHYCFSPLLLLFFHPPSPSVSSCHNFCHNTVLTQLSASSRFPF